MVWGGDILTSHPSRCEGWGTGAVVSGHGIATGLAPPVYLYEAWYEHAQNDILVREVPDSRPRLHGGRVLLMRSRFQLIEAPKIEDSRRRRILLLGEQRDLLEPSADVLRHLEADVAYCHPREIDARSKQRVELGVLCHTLSREKAASVAAKVREHWPEIRLIQMMSFSFGLYPIPSYADAVVGCGKVLRLFSTALELLGPPPTDQTPATPPSDSRGALGPVLLRRATHSE